MQNELPLAYEYTLESISSPTLYRPAYSASPVDAAGGIFVPQQRQGSSRCPGPMSSPPGMGRRRPEALIPLDAPTQPRKYKSPSSTSKKEIPSFFTKGRSNSLPTDGEEDELEEERHGLPATDKEEIEKRRRKNTLAARKSRMKKLEQKLVLEQTVERLTTEREIWRTRALTLRSLLSSNGIPCPEFED